MSHTPPSTAPAPAKGGVMQSITGFFTELMRRFIPDPIVFAIGLTVLVFILAITVEGAGPLEMITAWGDGFWDILAFAMQMCVILIAGYVLAKAPATDRLLDKLCSMVSTPRGAVILATLVGSIGSYINWGFGLMIGGVVAKKLATQIKGVHYPAIIASAYSGFTLYGLGLSATVPVVISAAGHPLEEAMGVIPLAQTIFSPPMLILSAITILTLPFLNAAMHPKPGQPVVEYDASVEGGSSAGPVAKAVEEGKKTLAAAMNDSRIVVFAIAAMAVVFVVAYFAAGQQLNINIINFIIIFAGMLLMKTPARYVAAFSEGTKTASGIILQFPFYAGILGIMAASGLVGTISDLFVQISTAETLPFWGIVSSFFINFFAPSGGGHWVIQGPFMMEAATALNSDHGWNAMAVQLGNAWNDLVQPFWILPALALSGLKLKDIMGYTVVDMFYVGVLYCAAMLIVGFYF